MVWLRFEYADIAKALALQILSETTHMMKSR